jgi:hypothetical protein
MALKPLMRSSELMFRYGWDQLRQRTIYSGVDGGIRGDFGVSCPPRKRALIFRLGVFSFCRVLRIGVPECCAHVLDGIEVVVAVAEFTFALLLGFGGVPGVDQELWFGILLLILFSPMSSYKRRPVQIAVWRRLRHLTSGPLERHTGACYLLLYVMMKFRSTCLGAS